ncbi:XRE family transcriptional regulator [Burkholderia contaminans]|uniref:helix-turn-helix domain-containing protein n=1 Tax=Burkholderia cepacia complex TaxID=87882 RepID=UPI0009471935|nr:MULTISPECIES: helix-turn-helix transcriptional regulator [Burkholderia cepacia complex]MCA7881885.1 helix-turn-helix domain-containing protein [Burkholderia contaminans]MCA8156156.1 helix-turn-helix domain-containing protein [Burkholderia contaminans]MDV3101319.1 helix-turn-helix domain-containing protein [Burkholderia cenocepacia]RQT06378.1 XRE family transcriptional regulator [Burkholderia contaminans]HEM7875423.1 helix-turn-helix transcriptional regulator [Burkholderia contaminans]
MNIGKALKLCRTAKDLSLEAVAERAEISTSYLSRIENQQREPTLTLVGKLAGALSVPMPVLIFLASDSQELRGLDAETEKQFADLALNLIRHS